MINLFKFKFYLSTLLLFFGIIGLIYQIYLQSGVTTGQISLENILPLALLLSGTIILAALKEPDNK